MTRIDFSASFLTWLTKNEGSLGRFQIEAVCSIRDGSSEQTETYYLAPAVMAGNVYAENDLVKRPVYLFQIAASEERNLIFRTFLSSGDDCCRLEENSSQFEEVGFHIVRREASALEEFGDLDLHFQKHHSISACMNYEVDRRFRIEIEFPVKHINIHRRKRLFQVETGPILIPSEDPDDQGSGWNSSFFRTAFVHFNRFDGAELTLNVPTRLGREMIRFFSQVKKFNPRIVLMADRD